MPIYEYQCAQCGHRLEEMQKFSDPPLVSCPACHKDALEKVISSAGFILKGSGWFKDGYGNPKTKRTDNQVTDRLTKAIDDDKKKTETSKTESAPTPTAPTSTTTSKD